jgi:hypothetical protein
MPNISAHLDLAKLRSAGSLTTSMSSADMGEFKPGQRRVAHSLIPNEGMSNAI